LEKLSIPILVSLLLQASLKHLDVNNMVNQALYSKQDSLKSAILSNITAPLILSPHSSQLLIINGIIIYYNIYNVFNKKKKKKK